MTNEDRSPEASKSRMAPGSDPLQMTEAEKRVAEWEARHDVAARGRRAGPDVLQHYFAHERLTHAAGPHPGAHPAAEPHVPEPSPAEPQPPVQSAPARPEPTSRGLLRRLFRRRR